MRNRKLRQPNVGSSYATLGRMNTQHARERRVEIDAADRAQHIVHGVNQNPVHHPAGFVDVVELVHGEVNETVSMSDDAEAPMICC